MRAGLIGLLVIIIIAAVVALNAFFIVNPTQQALVTQFGEVRQAIRDPGLNTKIPLVQDVLFLDKRVLDLNVPAQEIIAADQKRLVVDAFMRYRIANPVRFYQTVNNVREGATRLSTFAQSSLRAVLADATFQDIVRDDRQDLMLRIRDDVAARAKDIGVEVVDVRIRRADLPEANSEAIFNRMKTERVQEATQIRAQGREAAQRLRAAADRTSTVLRAEAQREAEQVRGQGDGQANAIFARAYSQDPKFFAFFRAMQAYETSMASKDTRLVLSPQSDFFRYFNDPLGQTGGRERGSPLGEPMSGIGATAAPGLTEAAPEGGADEAAAPAPEAAAGQGTQEGGEEFALSLPDAAAGQDTAPVEASVPADVSNALEDLAEIEGNRTAAERNAVGTNGNDAAAPDDAAPPAEAAELPAENVAIDPSAEPGQITIVRPDQKAE